MASNIQDWSYPNSDDQIDQDLAKFLYESHCALLIIEGLPINSEFGIDLSSYRIGHNFRGVKMIPPGVHFVFASAVDSNTNQTGPRCGFYHNFTAKELLVKRWSSHEEDFDDSFQVSEQQHDRYLSNLRDLDRYLGAYCYSTYKTFLNLTCKLTPELVEQIVPQNKRIRSVPFLVRPTTTTTDHKDGQEFEPNRSGRTKARRRTLRSDSDENDTSKPIEEEDLLPDLKPAQETVIRFTKLLVANRSGSAEFSGQPVATPASITQYHLDTTMKMDQLFAGQSGRARLLGEFQFAFVTLIIGHVYDCFEHWRNILTLVCQIDSGLVKYPDFFVEFAQILQFQLDQVSGDIFEDITQADNLIRHHLDTLFQNVQQTENIDRELAKQVNKLRSFLEQKLGWIFDLEPDDERPVIVEACG